MKVEQLEVGTGPVRERMKVEQPEVGAGPVRREDGHVKATTVQTAACRSPAVLTIPAAMTAMKNKPRQVQAGRGFEDTGAEFANSGRSTHTRFGRTTPLGQVYFRLGGDSFDELCW